MERVNNIQFFVDNYVEEKIPNKLYNLLAFTLKSKTDRNLFGLIILNIRKHNDEYIFEYNNKEYHFKTFSSYRLQQCDKKTLESTKRAQIGLIRTLKLACSMDLVNPRVAIGNSICGFFKPIILFREAGVDKVMDYYNNLVMCKEDYYELFKFNELNVINKMDLYYIYYILDKTEDFEHIYEYLLFTKEIFNDLSKNKSFKFINEKYDLVGINRSKYILYGNNSDALFFNDCDTEFENKYLQTELDDFTLNPSVLTKHISYDDKNGKYKLEDKKFGCFTFDLLSDIVGNQNYKIELLSDKRYHQCHKNSILIARSLEKQFKNTYVVAGLIKANEIDYYNHSWVEVEEKNIVIDYNKNVIMNKDKYYELMGAKVISRTSISLLEEVIQTIIFDFGLNLHFL